MGYPYEDLDDAQFERLVVQVAKKLFGAGVQGFAAGPDGGRDARFAGTAERFPSMASPWGGITIIQAKHTNATNTHFSDAGFSGDSVTSVLSEELPRIKHLAGSEELDNYFLVANRRLGANSASAIIKRIASSSGVAHSQIFLAGIEYLDEMLHQYPEIIGLARIDPLDGPLLASSYDLAEVIIALATDLDATSPPAVPSTIERTSYEEKNILNRMSQDFANTLQNRYLPLTRQIDDFLADPANSATTQHYEGAVDELQLKLIAFGDQYPNFDTVFNHLFDTMVSRDGVLASKKRLTRAMLFYMYWHCDIGKTASANTY